MQEEAGSVPFAVVVAGDPVRTTLTLIGDLDHAAVQRLELAFEEAAERGTRNVLVDLRSLTFIDSAGVRVLLRAAETDRFGLEAVRGPDVVQHMLKHLGVDEVLRFVEA